MTGRTTFVIATASTIRDADTILVMERGSILVEQSTHDALLARGGACAELYRSQFAEPLAEAV